MKKLVAAACALAAGMVLADAEVTSANVVGYQTLTLHHGWNMFSINFASLDNENGMTLAEIFPSVTNGVPRQGFTFGMTFSSADYVKVWNAEDQGYNPTTYYLYYRASGSAAVTENNYKWVTGPRAPAETRIKSGAGYWFYLQGDSEVTIPVAGQVEYAASGTSITIHPGWNMIGSPYAAGLNLNAMGTAYWQNLVNNGVVTAGMTFSSADYIKTWNAADQGYNPTTYYLYYRATGSAAVTENNYKWVSGPRAVAPDAINELGQGMWYYHQGNTTFTLELPYPYTIGE